MITEAERMQLQDLAQRQGLLRRSQMLGNYAFDLQRRAREALLDPVGVPQREPRPGEMLIVMVPAGSGDPRWVTMEFAGSEPVTCAGADLEMLTGSITIPGSLADAVVFTLNENVVGFVRACNDRLVVLTPESYISLGKVMREQETMTCCGVRFAAASGDQANRLVAELRVGSILDRAGVEPGDRISSINGNAVGTNEALRLLLQAPLLQIEVVRADRVKTLQYRPPSAGNGAELEASASGARVRSVAAGTIAEKVGLKPGDVIVRVGDNRRPVPAAIDKTMTSSPGSRFVVLRGDRRILLETPDE